MVVSHCLFFHGIVINCRLRIFVLRSALGMYDVYLHQGVDGERWRAPHPWLHLTFDEKISNFINFNDRKNIFLSFPAVVEKCFIKHHVLPIKGMWAIYLQQRKL